MESVVAGLAATLAANGRDLDALVDRMQRLIDQHHDLHATMTGFGVKMDAMCDSVTERFDRVDARLDKINGTVRNHGERIAVVETKHEARVGCAVDPPPPVIKDKRTWAVSGVASAFVGLVLFVWEALQAYLKAK